MKIAMTSPASYCIGSDSYAGTIAISTTGKRATFKRSEGFIIMELYLDKNGRWREINGGGSGYVHVGKAVEYRDPSF